MSDPSQATTRGLSREEFDYEIQRMRIQVSSQYVGRMIWLVTIIAGAMALVIVVSVVVLSFIRILSPDLSPALMQQPIPDVLTNWGGVILGFYFWSIRQPGERVHGGTFSESASRQDG